MCASWRAIGSPFNTVSALRWYRHMPQSRRCHQRDGLCPVLSLEPPSLILTLAATIAIAVVGLITHTFTVVAAVPRRRLPPPS